MRNNEFLARHSKFDADVKWLPAPVMPMRRLDDYAAARDAVEILVELVRFLLDSRRHSGGCVDVSEGRLNWKDHAGWFSFRFESLAPHRLVGWLREEWVRYGAFLG